MGRAKSATSKAGKKRAGSAKAFSSMKARQKAVERLKRAIWSSAQQINEALIKLASSGNLAAMKELFDFAGVYSVPTEGEEEAVVGAAPVAAAATPVTTSGEMIDGMPIEKIDRFFSNLGIEPSVAEPESEMGEGFAPVK